MRKQFPLRHSAAKTIHRAQGDTLDEVVVDFSSSRKQAHIHYVGLSRVRKLEGLHILNLCHGKIHISPDVQQEMAELRDRRQLLCPCPVFIVLTVSSLKWPFSMPGQSMPTSSPLSLTSPSWRAMCICTVKRS